MKRKKKIIIGAITIGIGFSLLISFMMKNHSGSVPVIAVYQVMDQPYDETTQYGTILAGSSESYKKTNSEVAEIYVQEGDTVTPGDPLFRYETASLEIAKETAANDLQLASLAEEKAEAELARWQSYEPYTPYVPYTIETEDLINEESEPIKGDGSEDNPYVYHCSMDTKVVPAYLSHLMTADVKYIQFVIYDQKEGADMVPVFIWSFDSAYTDEKQSAVNEIATYPGVWNIGEDLSIDASGCVSGPEDNGFAKGVSTGTAMPDAPSVSERQSHTAEEIAETVASKRQEIASLKIDVKQAQVDYDKAAAAAVDGIVTTSCNGTITKLADLNTLNEGDVFMNVTSDTGFVVETTVSEFDINEIQKGSKLTVTSYTNGASSDAEVTYISESPVSDEEGSIPDTSYYRVRASLKDGDQFVVDDFVETVVHTENNDSSFYIPLMYVRKVDGSYYVMKAENGRLKKQIVKTGRSMYGYEIEIKDGLSEDDYIAFPYGKNVKEGAPCDLSEEDLSYEYE